MEAIIANVAHFPIGGKRDIDALICEKARKSDFAGANALFTLYFDREMIAHAKSKGMFVAQEYYASPRLPIWHQEELLAFDEFRSIPFATGFPTNPDEQREKFDLADLTVVPSRFVERECAELGCDLRHTVVIPYPIGQGWFEISNTPSIGRVLFVGSVTPAKGIHYLAMAARILRARNVKAEVRVVGGVSEELRGLPLFEGLTFVGAVPRSEVWREFQKADVLVFPTLCDSFGLVQLEALASGVPVITTANCGEAVNDGCEGFICPIRDPTALADRITEVISDRALRETMSLKAREKARAFGFEAYSASLANAILRCWTART
jgi:glycosyltransferase involved in cell wall biosynthesis